MKYIHENCKIGTFRQGSALYYLSMPVLVVAVLSLVVMVVEKG